jgi:hypothetical protein
VQQIFEFPSTFTEIYRFFTRTGARDPILRFTEISGRDSKTQMTWMKRVASFAAASAVLSVLALSAGADFFGSGTTLIFGWHW